MNRTLNDGDTVGKKRALDEPKNMGSLSFIKADQAAGVTDTKPIGTQTSAASLPRTISQEDQASLSTLKGKVIHSDKTVSYYIKDWDSEPWRASLRAHKVSTAMSSHNQLTWTKESMLWQKTWNDDLMTMEPIRPATQHTIPKLMSDKQRNGISSCQLERTPTRWGCYPTGRSVHINYRCRRTSRYSGFKGLRLLTGKWNDKPLRWAWMPREGGQESFEMF